MPCYHPQKGHRAKAPNPLTGKYRIVFKNGEADLERPLIIPCGYCIGCRLEHSRQWAIRAVHEAKCYEQNSFITLTYSPEHLPPKSSLRPRDTQLFMKRLRKMFGSKIRSFGCAEYGEKLQRPHYHLCLFNHDFPDKKIYKQENGFTLHTSEILTDLWDMGQCIVGPLNFETAAYTARYVTKKILGSSDRADAAKNFHYGFHGELDILTNEKIYDRLPEQKICVSRRPGLGRPWLDKYKSDVYPSDEVIIRFKSVKPPKYYDNIFDVENPEKMDTIKRIRREKLALNAADNTYERLKTREELATIMLQQKQRKIEK